MKLWHFAVMVTLGGGGWISPSGCCSGMGWANLCRHSGDRHTWNLNEKSLFKYRKLNH